jgi:hypothetical protein
MGNAGEAVLRPQFGEQLLVAANDGDRVVGLDVTLQQQRGQVAARCQRQRKTEQQLAQKTQDLAVTGNEPGMGMNPRIIGVPLIEGDNVLRVGGHDINQRQPGIATGYRLGDSVHVERRDGDTEKVDGRGKFRRRHSGGTVRPVSVCQVRLIE